MQVKATEEATATTVMSLNKSCFDGNKLCGGSVIQLHDDEEEEEEELDFGFGLFFFVEEDIEAELKCEILKMYIRK